VSQHITHPHRQKTPYTSIQPHSHAHLRTHIACSQYDTDSNTQPDIRIRIDTQTSLNTQNYRTPMYRYRHTVTQKTTTQMQYHPKTHPRKLTNT